MIERFRRIGMKDLTIIGTAIVPILHPPFSIPGYMFCCDCRLTTNKFVLMYNKGDLLVLATVLGSLQILSSANELGCGTLG